jgi:hypothetical protein
MVDYFSAHLHGFQDTGVDIKDIYIGPSAPAESSENAEDYY